MHSDFENSFTRIHLLYHANQNAITPEQIQPEINSHGYQFSPEHVKQELDHLTSEGYLTSDGSLYDITLSGKDELRSVQLYLETLYQEVGHSDV
ncbi:hypothetical protein M3650_18755 [Paenibacillus sp. MER TA 81-3]|uniref:hypothetical protein n=1 Tax=Paenibacillus sp. MER TA 81-3 TaxID=2939573 RepID=UPI00203C9377|nr:hypothetical protein [Paenibacillus sp. MER TA 81-3]MCM3340616.1 hypothetical protein [Paenibacillus sp. MER TA 81-3]